MTTYQPTSDHVCACTPADAYRPRWWTVLAGQLAATVVYVLAVPVAGVDLVARSGGDSTTIDLGLVLAVSLVVGVAAVGWMVVLRRLTDHPDRNWVITASIVLLLSLAGPAGAASLGAGIALGCMHVAVAGGLAVGSLRLR